MLTLMVGQTEFYDEEAEKFVWAEGQKVELEHSLASLSKWESLHEKPFLTKDEKTQEEILSYIQCMILSPEDSPDIVQQFSQDDLVKINEYIEGKHSATTFPESKAPPSREIVTSELIYYWMVAFQIPFTCETWNLNRLLSLVRICNIRNQSPKKMSKAEVMRRNSDLNAQRRAMHGSSG